MSVRTGTLGGICSVSLPAGRAWDDGGFLVPAIGTGQDEQPTLALSQALARSELTGGGFPLAENWNHHWRDRRRRRIPCAHVWG